MKIRLKISLLAIVMVVTATGLCSLIMLIRSGQSNLELAVNNALTDQQLRLASFQEGMGQNLNGGFSPISQRSLARYYMDKFGGDFTVLMSGDDVIFNRMYISPKDMLPLEAGARKYVIKDAGDRTILFTGISFEVNNTPYSLYTVTDVTSVFTGVEAMSRQFTLVNSIIIAFCALIIVVLLRLVLRPVSELKKNTGLIADGVYDRRIEIKEQDEIGDLARDFNTMAHAVETHINELKEQAERRALFNAALTHELKTPVTSISGNAQTLLLTKMDEEGRADALLRINDECTRLERLSQKMMRLITLEQGEEIHLRQSEVSGLFDTVQRSCHGLLKERGVVLRTECRMDTLEMDADLMASLLLNLIDNAAKASRKGDYILLRAYENIIAVTDRGKGIPKDEIPKLTQPFYMVDKSRSKRSGGIGLGLALCEMIAKLHHASLVFESQLGIGTTVKVVFKNA